MSYTENERRDLESYARGDAMARAAKVIGQLAPGLLDELTELSNADLKKRALSAGHHLSLSERRRKTDKDLAEAKARYDAAKAPYDDAKKLQTAIQAYGMLLLETRGDPVTEADIDPSDIPGAAEAS